MVDRMLSKLGTGLALLLMFSELTYVNSKSLHYLASAASSYLGTHTDFIDTFFSVVGAMAFSIVTIIVMRKSREKWVKVVFPLFDTLLVFCGFNLAFADAIVQGNDNPVRFWLSVFMAIFTGLITYSLGLINFLDHEGNSNNQHQIIEELKADNQRNIEELKAIHEGNSNNQHQIIETLKEELNETTQFAEQLLASHILYKSWSARKKSESNRTDDELRVIHLAERLKQGESVSISEFKN